MIRCVFFPGSYPSLWSLSSERKCVLFEVSFSVLPGPDSVAFESRRDLDDVLFSDPDLDLTGIVHHLYGVTVGRLVAGLGHCKQSRAQPSPSLVESYSYLLSYWWKRQDLHDFPHWLKAIL